MPKDEEYAVQELRERLGLTQAQFAEALDVSPSTIIRWEQGQSKPTQIARARMDEMARVDDRRKSRDNE